MNHQDWTPVIITKKQAKPVSKVPIFVKEKDVHIDGYDPDVSKEFSNKLIQARGKMSMKDMSIKAGQLGKQLSIKDIQNVEMRKCTMKQAKQIALIYEKILKLKIL